MNYEQNEKIAKEKFSKLIEEKTIDDIKNLCKSEIDINSNLSKVWVVDYLQSPSAELMLSNFYDQLNESELILLIIIKPEKVFKKVYLVKDKNDNNVLICLFNNNCIDLNKVNEIYEDVQEEFTIKKFFENYDNSKKKEKEIYDPLDFIGTQKKIDEIKQKYDNGEITIIDILKDAGYKNAEKLNQIINDLINKKINNDDLLEKIKSQEINNFDILIINSMLEKFHPEILEELNK